MRFRGDHWPIRLMGCLFGVGALGLGGLGFFSGDDQVLSPGERADHLDFSLVALATGLIALLGSLFTPDIRALWFCNPERSKEIAKHAGATLKNMLFGRRRG